MQADVGLVVVALVFYALAAIQALLSLARPSAAGERRIQALLLFACLPMAVLLVLRGCRLGHIPAFTQFEAVSAYVLVFTVVYLLFTSRHSLRGISAIVVPYVAILLVLVFPGVETESSGGPAVQSVWLGLHILTAFAGYALFTLAAALAVAYLIQDHNLKHKRFGAVFQRLPALETLDHLMYHEIGLAFAIFSLSIVLGALKVRMTGGGPEWFVDPKIVATGATWALYAVLMHIRGGARRGKRIALMTLAGLLLVLFTFVGVSQFADSVHDKVRVGAPYGERQ